MTLTNADQPPLAPRPAAEGSELVGGIVGSIAAGRKLGDAPPSNTLAFLRQQAILLEPGQHQFDWGLSYSVFNETFALPLVNHVRDGCRRGQ